MTELVVDWCSYEAAKFAVLHWHYSKRMPTPPIDRIGAWEDGVFVGCVLFSRGANNNLGKPYDLTFTQVAELMRVALNVHVSPTTKIVSAAIRLVANKNEGLRLIVSFADANEGHIGTLYQAGNWLFCGMAKSTPKFIDKAGRVLHSRQVSKVGYKPQYGTMRRVPKIEDCEVVPQLDKYRYLYPLDRAMRRQIEPLRQPYPKKQTCGPSVQGDMPGVQPGEPGSSPGVRSMTGAMPELVG